MSIATILKLIRTYIYQLYVASSKELPSHKVHPGLMNWLGFSPFVEKASSLFFGRWIAPPNGWTKLNCKRAFKGNPGHSCGGGVIRDNSRALVYTFDNYYGISTSIWMEAMAVLDDLEVAKSKLIPNV